MNHSNNNMPAVVFFADTHTYWHGETKLESVGSFFKRFKPDFREQYWLTHTALKNIFGKEYQEHYRSLSGMTPDPHLLFGPFMSRVNPTRIKKEKRIVRDKWKRKTNESNFNGSKFHDEREAESRERGYLINPFDGKQYPIPPIAENTHYHNESLTDNLWELPDGGYPELLVFDLEMGVAGQADEVFIETVDGVRYIDIHDFKTNEKKPQKSAPDRFIPPFDHLYNSKHVGYSLQISGYGLLLENHGFTVRKLAYSWYKEYKVESQHLVEVEYMKDTILAMVNEEN